MSINSKILKYTIPDSETDSNYEDFEFMLIWKHPTGAFLPYLFTDWQFQNNVDIDILNMDDSDNMENLIKSKKRAIKLIAEDVSLNDRNVLETIAESKIIYRLYKDGSWERIGLSDNSFQARQSDKRYNVELNLFLYSKPLQK